VVEAVVLRVSGRRHRFDAVPHEKCNRCGERIFGLDASKRFDAVLTARGHTRAA